MEQGPCKDAARVLENELTQHRELLPHTITYDGKRVPMTMERLSREHPDISDTYLLDLLERFLDHFKETGDPKKSRVSALRHGDRSLMTMLSAFVPNQDKREHCNYLTMTREQLGNLSIHRLLIAREMGAKILKKNEIPTSLSTFYRELVTISGHRNPVYCVAFDKTNRRLFTGSDDFLVKVWCVRTGYLIHTIRGHQNIITDIAINQENTLIATASSDGCVRVWTMDEYKPIMCLKPNAATIKPFTTVKFSPSPKNDTRYLMATNEDGLVRLWRWDRETLEFFDIDSPITFSCKFRARDRLRCSSFNYTGTQFAVAGDDGFVYVFSAVPVQAIHEGITTNSHDHSNNLQHQSQGGRGRRRVPSVLFPDKSGQTQAQPVVPIGILEGHMGSVTDLAYSHDGQRILSGCQDGTARIWNFNKSTKEWNSVILDLKQSVDTHIVQHQALSNNISPVDQKQHVDTEEFGLFIPFDNEDDETTDMNQTSEEDMHPEPISPTVDQIKVSMIAWSSDDKWCMIASNQGEIRVYYAYDGSPACILKGHQGEIYALDNHPLDSSTLLSAGYDGNVILWDLTRRKIITQHQHIGRTFTDCKFSKDGMKYAITDEEGHCTLFGIGGLDKDYEQVRSWERGQYFISDYQALRHFTDGSFVDEATQLMPYSISPSPIIDLQGVAYPNQKKLGYGRNIPTLSETFEFEDSKRNACYDMEEEEIRKIKVIKLPTIDRATIARKRRDFVKSNDDEDTDLNGNIPFQFPPPLQPFLLPDDSEDEDYREDGPDNAPYASSGESSEGEGSDDFVARDDQVESDAEQEDEGPITRSRAGQRRSSQSPVRGNTRPSIQSTRRPNAPRRRGRPRTSRDSMRSGTGRRGRPTRKRNRDRSEDEEEEEPVRPRFRRRLAHVSYLESDPDDIEDEQEEEEDNVTVDDDHMDVYVNIDSFERNNKTNDYPVASSSSYDPRTSTSTMTTRRSAAANGHPPLESEDRKGKRILRSTVINDDDEDDYHEPYSNQLHNSGGASSSFSSHALRPKRTRSYQPEIAAKPSAPAAKAAPPPSKRSGKQRGFPRVLSKEEIELFEPIPWIKNVKRSFSKYLPQTGDYIVILTEGHRQYLRQSEIKELFDEKHGVIDKHEPVLFAQVAGMSWQVGPPTFCKLKVSLVRLQNIQQVLMHQATPVWTSLHREEVIDYSDEDGCPEFIVLWERFYASMDIFRTLQVGQAVDAVYDESGTYSGTVTGLNSKGIYWKQANLPSPWAYYHIVWDDPNSKPDDMCPWELVPRGQDFQEKYNVSPFLKDEEIQRAKDILIWLASSDEFALYVQQVDYYEYPSYLTIVPYPMCLDMILERLENGFYRSKQGVIDDIELIKKNAMRYNDESSAAHKNAIRMANFFKSRLTNPHMPLSWAKGGGRKKMIIDQSDDEYQEEPPREESDEEPVLKKSKRELSDDEDEDFVVDDDDYE
ncbi:hypothetical protein G6F57_010467 [Rhizopus arrhizus]|uniref:Bromo domain-containing protein n=1 Tax=Rhizopus oryzae TaxID=64495 RepID=A0A9P7BNJ6_RHIOR|nr:hypothetical protein G6F24_010084 [Rhizopus arrhizus]KAG1413208.1 hypothetical protein G6F58_007612 [Rhizopus delemar]KAG0783750.1 hypothetical protein G6F21_010346 [Rhizopus arrhizus]KAG0797144.1 hypothetical protein G6F22_004763 [Rhizopus arrhizus]KAG0810114.1 hypothetical protein G6F20_008229 [Rhizopus arrhizus]